MFTKAIMIINEYVFAIAENKIVAKCKLWVLSITLPLINSACLIAIDFIHALYTSCNVLAE